MGRGIREGLAFLKEFGPPPCREGVELLVPLRSKARSGERTLAQPRMPTFGGHDSGVAVGRAERWEQRKPKVVAIFGSDAETLRRVSDVLELMEMAWHDCYREVTPSDEVIDEILLCSGGTLGGLIDAARLAVADRRDLQLWADDVRAKQDASGARRYTIDGPLLGVHRRALAQARLIDLEVAA
jgi:hypothetical protein